MDYTINVDVHRWKKGQVVSEAELKSEGITISKWIANKLIVEPEKPKLEGDLNGDGKLDAQDSKIANDTLNALKKQNKKGVR